MTRQVVSVLVGLQASGKTTFTRLRLSADAVVVSKDDFPNARRRQVRQMRLIDAALDNGDDVVVDNTNPSEHEWAPIVAAARAHDARVVAYFFEPDVAACYSRNASRTDKHPVPDVGFYTTVSRLRRPKPSYGFHEVFVVRTNDEGEFDVRLDEPDESSR